LFVIDGAKALHKAISDSFGERALIQRCREHKKRNVTDALPERMRSSVRSAMHQAYATATPSAPRLLENLPRRLEPDHPGAAASLREGLEETLTLTRLDLPESLERVLSSTNSIENLFSRVRELARRVKRSRAQLPQDR
jgi:transposase-like protein